MESINMTKTFTTLLRNKKRYNFCHPIQIHAKPNAVLLFCFSFLRQQTKNKQFHILAIRFEL